MVAVFRNFYIAFAKYQMIFLAKTRPQLGKGILLFPKKKKIARLVQYRETSVMMTQFNKNYAPWASPRAFECPWRLYIRNGIILFYHQ
jgi:hypothetical protein